MRKKISLLVCMLIAVLAFTTGCGAKKEALEYDETEVTQLTEFVIQYCSFIDEQGLEELKSMREFTFEQQLAESQIPLTPEAFIGAVESWQAGENECGAFIEHGDYAYKVNGDELIVTTEGTFENRDAEIMFVFNDDLYLETVTVSAHFTIGEILKKAGLNTLLGMGTVFAVLILISVIISMFKYIPALQDALRRKPKNEVKEVVKEAAPAVAAPVVTSTPEMNDAELIAVIAAAIAASEGTTTDGFVVRSIKRRKSNKWN